MMQIRAHTGMGGQLWMAGKTKKDRLLIFNVFSEERVMP